MNLEYLKKGLFGYTKSSVYQYLATLEEEFSSQLLKKEEQAQAAAQQYQEKISQLEQTLSETRKQLENQTKEQSLIAQTLMEAKRFAQNMQKEAEEKEKAYQEQWKAAMQKKEQELQTLDTHLKQIREMFGTMLHSLDEQAQSTQKQVQKLKESCPHKTITLLEQKNGEKDKRLL